VQRAIRFAARPLVAERGVEDAGVLQVRRHLDAGDGDEANARIVHLARQHRRQLVANLIGDTIGSRSLRHQRTA